MKVVFLQTAHPVTDDRIVHQMRTLTNHGVECAYVTKRETNDRADYIICDTPKAVLCNVGYSGIVLYDITEWYPSKKNLRPFFPVLRPLIAMAMVVLSLLAGIKTDRFIFGEVDKGRPFRFLFWWKRYCYLPYYPSLTLFEKMKSLNSKNQDQPLKVLYAGPLTEEKGYYRALQVAKVCGIELTVLSPNQYMPLLDFCQYIQGFDVALDLRDCDMENRRCLPIKLFYYWAAGVVPIYSNLDAIHKNIQDARNAVFLVNSTTEAQEYLSRLKTDKILLRTYREKGHNNFLHYFNWEAVEDRLISIISQP